MTLNDLEYFFKDIRYFKLFHKKYKPTQIADYKERCEYWSKVGRAYNNFKKRVDCSYYHWYVITYKDGRKELAYFKVWHIVIPHGGRLCRGLIPRYFGTKDYEHIQDIRLAF